MLEIGMHTFQPSDNGNLAGQYTQTIGGGTKVSAYRFDPYSMVFEDYASGPSGWLAYYQSKINWSPANPNYFEIQYAGGAVVYKFTRQ